MTTDHIPDPRVGAEVKGIGGTHEWRSGEAELEAEIEGREIQANDRGRRRRRSSLLEQLLRLGRAVMN
jgi:hypothetical protein